MKIWYNKIGLEDNTEYRESGDDRLEYSVGNFTISLRRNDLKEDIAAMLIFAPAHWTHEFGHFLGFEAAKTIHKATGKVRDKLAYWGAPATNITTAIIYLSLIDIRHPYLNGLLAFLMVTNLYVAYFNSSHDWNYKDDEIGYDLQYREKVKKYIAGKDL